MKNLKKIALITSLSKTSQKALDYAKTLAQKFESKILLVHMPESKFPEFKTSLPSNVEEAIDFYKRKALASLNMLVAACEQNGVSCEKHLLDGSPKKEVPIFVKENDIDFLIMEHEHTPKWFGKSTIDEVIEKTSCPTLLITQ